MFAFLLSEVVVKVVHLTEALLLSGVVGGKDSG